MSLDVITFSSKSKSARKVFRMLELTQEAIATLRDLLLDIGRQSARDGLDHRRCVAQQRDTCMQYCRKIKTNLIMFEAARAKRHSINLKPERGVAAKTQAALSHLGASFEVSLNDATSPTSMGQQIEAILPEELAYLINCFSLCMVLLSHQLEISYQLNRIFPLDDSGKVCEMPYGEQMEENSQTANTAPVNPWLVEIEAALKELKGFQEQMDNRSLADWNTGEEKTSKNTLQVPSAVPRSGSDTSFRRNTTLYVDRKSEPTSRQLIAFTTTL